jgi:hypothetical protein
VVRRSEQNVAPSEMALVVQVQDADLFVDLGVAIDVGPAASY